MTNSTEKKGVYTGIIEKDANGNFFKITIKTIIENPSDISYGTYPKKTKNFALFNLKP
jgi:hypothetical protein